jgi:hypothetical protein
MSSHEVSSIRKAIAAFGWALIIDQSWNPSLNELVLFLSTSFTKFPAVCTRSLEAESHPQNLHFLEIEVWKLDRLQLCKKALLTKTSSRLQARPPATTRTSIERDGFLQHRLWQDMTTEDFENFEDIENLVAILPVAAIEQHGPHLPVCTDACINEVG